MMTFWLVAFALSLTGFLIAYVLEQFHARWCTLPEFYNNTVGGVVALCGIAAYNKAVERKQFVSDPRGRNLVFVRESIVFGRGSDPNFAGKVGMSHRGQMYPETQEFWHMQEQPDLFVPFTSDRLITLDEQQKAFIKPPADLKTFAEQQRQENGRADLRLRLVYALRVPRIRRVETACLALGVAAFVSFLGVLFVLSSRADEAMAKEEVIIQTTTPGSDTVNEIRMSRKDTVALPMVEDRQLMYIWRGTYLEARSANLGGNARWVCLTVLKRRQALAHRPGAQP